jgi:anti-anti-sigma regulatory factor
MSVVVPGPHSVAPPQRSGAGGTDADVSAPRADLAVWTDMGSGRCVLRMRGRLCQDTVAVFDRHVDRLGWSWCDEVVVDLSSVVLMDRVGARLVVGLGHYVAGRGGRFGVQGASPEHAAVMRAAEAELAG